MKKLLIPLLALALLFALAACGQVELVDDPLAMDEEVEEVPAGDIVPEEGYDLALIIDTEGIEDKGFNQWAWAGIREYAEEFDISHAYFQAIEQSDAAYVEAIAEAVAAGAKLVVCPGLLFEAAIYEAQYTYPDICFVLLNGEPHSSDYSTYAIENNVYSVFYAEEQAGFLAGYAVVKEGYSKLGFIGGMAVPEVIAFGGGFLQGVDIAAAETGISCEVLYHYTGGFSATPEAQAMASAWYTNDIGCIIAYGGSVGEAVMAAAETANATMIGVEVDQSSLSDTIIISAVKGIQSSVYDALEKYYAGAFPGGQILHLTAQNNGVGLSMESSRFISFTEEEYLDIFNKLAQGDIIPVRNTNPGVDVGSLVSEAVLVTVIEN